MGTRADYYIGRGKTAEWLGSSAWDGCPEGVPGIVAAKTEEEFRSAVAERVSKEDGTRPAMGWPWPWDNSNITDYSYAWDDGRAWRTHYSRGWVPADLVDEEEGEGAEAGPLEFPDMTSRKKVTLGPRSGVIVARG